MRKAGEDGPELDVGDAAGPTMRLYVWALRLWLDGAWGQRLVWDQFATALGARDGCRVAALFESHVAAVTAGAMRPLRREASGASGLCEDERLLARTVALSAQGEWEQAALCARDFLDDETLGIFLQTAAALGGALARIAQPRQRNAAPAILAAPLSAALH